MAESTLKKTDVERFRPRQSPADLLARSWKLFTLPLLLFIALPIIALFLRLTPASLFTLQEQQVVQAVRLSLLTSLATVLISLIFGTPVAYLLYRRRSVLYPAGRYLDRPANGFAARRRRCGTADGIRSPGVSRQYFERIWH
jgi:hypothetical protein